MLLPADRVHRFEYKYILLAFHYKYRCQNMSLSSSAEGQMKSKSLRGRGEAGKHTAHYTGSVSSSTNPSHCLSSNLSTNPDVILGIFVCELCTLYRV